MKTGLSFPGESAQYRAAREALLADEVALRRLTEEVAAKRRALPLGGQVTTDYAFDEIGPGGDGFKTKLSELFAPAKDTLVVYNMMFGPDMEAACPLCTSIVDGLESQARHITQQVNLAVVVKSPLRRIMDFALTRGWRDIRLLSSAGNTYNRDYLGESAEGDQQPMLNVFVKRDGKIYHTYATEMFNVPFEKGKDPRHVDILWPLWNVLDFTPGGRGSGWYPKLAY